MRRAALSFSTLLFLATLASADFRDSHKDGVDALENGRWAEAAKHFRAAIEERGEEKVGFRRYTPFYYLGVSLAELEDCRGALKAFRTSLGQGEIQKTREIDDLKKRQGSCESHLEKVSSAKKETEVALEGARQAAEEVETLGQKPEAAAIWTEGSRSFAALQSQAQERLRRTQLLLRQGDTDGDLEMIAEARRRAVEITNSFLEIGAEAQRRLGALDAATESALQKVEAAEGGLRRSLASVKYLAPYPPQLGRRVAEGERALREVGEAKEQAGPDELEELESRLNNSLARLRQAAERPPGTLADAAEAFFSGEYEEALTILGDKSYRSRRNATHLCLIRAAAHHSLHVLQGGADEERLAAAVESVADCSRIDPLPAPHPRFYSPRFLAFYESTLEALAQAELEAEEAAMESGDGSDPAADS